MNIENALYRQYDKYMIEKSQFSPDTYNDVPQNFSKFPTITFVESDNVDETISTEFSEYTSHHIITINIYTTDKTLDKKYPRKAITDELKYLTFDFLRLNGLRRTACTKGEYLDVNVDRTIIVAECSANSWNREIR